jgi:maltose alpha-D-glucosyltransferase/alpha-amylase
MRVHGNLHLGKVLLVEDDFLITGFEGDASVPLAMRRAKDSPLRDVAVLLNSLSSARTVAFERATMGRPELRERIDTALADYEKVAIEALLAGYARGGSRAPALKGADNIHAQFVTLFRIDRALRELTRELTTPNAWNGLALRFLLRELEGEHGDR